MWPRRRKKPNNPIQQLKVKGFSAIQLLKQQGKEKKWFFPFKVYKYSEAELLDGRTMSIIDSVITDLNELIRTKIKGKDLSIKLYDEIIALIEELKELTEVEIETIQLRPTLKGESFEQFIRNLKKLIGF